MDMYDSVLVIIELSNNLFAVPAVRVLSGTSLQGQITKAMADPENRTPRYRYTKGLPNAGYGIFWAYWIPCAGGRWLYLQSEDMKTLGRRQGMMVTDAEISSRLNEADMNVSFSTADDVKDALKLSRDATAVLQALL
jgi:hypothetical protein